MFTSIVRRQVQFLVLGVTLVSLLLLFLPKLPVNAASFTVDILTDSNDANPGNGICADSAGKCSIRAGVQETNALAGADTLNIPAGEYVLDGSVFSTGLLISGDLNITGAGPNTTKLTAINFTSQFKIITVSSSNLQVNISGIELTSDTLTNGFNCEIGLEKPLSVNINIDNSKISACLTGLELYSGYSEITNTVIENNNNKGVNLTNAEAVFDNVTIQGNFRGMNIEDFDDNENPVRILNSKIQNNHSEGDGGGIYMMRNCYTLNTSVYISNTEIINNTAYQGGGIYNQCGKLTLDKVTMEGNGATEGNGAGLYLNYDYSNDPGDGYTKITHSTFSGNLANENGAIYVVTDRPNSLDGFITLDMMNNTIANNSSGIIFDPNDTQEVNYIDIRMRNNLLSNNDSFNCRFINSEIFDPASGYFTGNNNLSSDTTCNSLSSFSIDTTLPDFLGPLQNNGGNTHTHALLAGSGAINSGSNTDCPAQDQANQPRPSGVTCDVGAFEFQDNVPPQPTPTNFAFNGTLYLDLNNNGVKDSTDTLFPNTSIEILDSNGNLVLTLTTDNFGNFNGTLPLGNYTYRIVALEEYGYGARNQTFIIGNGVNTFSIPLIVNENQSNETPTTQIKNLIRTGGY